MVSGFFVNFIIRQLNSQSLPMLLPTISLDTMFDDIPGPSTSLDTERGVENLQSPVGTILKIF